MFDNVMLIIGAIFTWALGLAFITLNTGGNVGPYFIGALCLVFSGYALFVCGKYWDA